LVVTPANVRLDALARKAGRQFEKSMTTIKQLLKTFTPDFLGTLAFAVLIVLAFILI